MIEVAVKAVEERPGRPPMVWLFVNITASNPTSSSRWLLIPRKLPATAGGVFKNEQQAAGSVIYGAFLGNGGFYAFLLAPGAKMTIKNLELGWWNDARASSPPPLDVRIGTAVTVAGADLATWFDRDPAASGTAEVDAGAAQHTHSHKSPTGADLDVTVAGLETRAVAVAH